MHRYLLNGILFGVLLDKKDDNGGGGGAAPTPEEKEAARTKEFEDLKASNAALMKRLDALDKKKNDDPPADDPGLKEKADAAAKAKAKQASDQKSIEAALKFSLGAKDWLKDNATLLPKDIDGIFSAAESEKYDSAVEKDGAIKSAVIQKFFEVQSNLDLLTTSQKSALDEFLKLTKNAKQEQSQKMYEQVFEPTFEMLKRLEKAKQLRNDGQNDPTNSDQKYKERMIALSRKHYLGEKANA